MDHFKPHLSSAFEGYYSKFRLPSGASLALIVSSVKQGTSRPHMVSVTYVARDSKSFWQREYWPSSIEFIETGPSSFDMRIPDFGSVVCVTDGEMYHIKTDDFELRAETVRGSRQPWISESDSSTPAGLLVHAPLPLHWHVHTLASRVTFNLDIHSRQGELHLLKQDCKGTGTVHHEKNWAQSFPSKYIWIQAWDESRQRGLCVAGGEALPGVEAYLLTYTRRAESDDTQESITFTPPWTFGILGISPFCKSVHDYRRGQSSLDVSNFTRRIKIDCQAPRDTFFQLSAPLPEGHRANFACESFAAKHTVTVYKRNWFWQAWRVEFTDSFEDASLEYGGGYYDDAGGKAKDV